MARRKAQATPRVTLSLSMIKMILMHFSNEDWDDRQHLSRFSKLNREIGEFAQRRLWSYFILDDEGALTDLIYHKVAGKYPATKLHVREIWPAHIVRQNRETLRRMDEWKLRAVLEQVRDVEELIFERVRPIHPDFLALRSFKNVKKLTLIECSTFAMPFNVQKRLAKFTLTELNVVDTALGQGFLLALGAKPLSCLTKVRFHQNTYVRNWWDNTGEVVDAKCDYPRTEWSDILFDRKTFFKYTASNLVSLQVGVGDFSWRKHATDFTSLENIYLTSWPKPTSDHRDVLPPSLKHLIITGTKSQRENTGPFREAGKFRDRVIDVSWMEEEFAAWLENDLESDKLPNLHLLSLPDEEVVAELFPKLMDTLREVCEPYGVRVAGTLTEDEIRQYGLDLFWQDFSVVNNSPKGRWKRYREAQEAAEAEGKAHE